VTLMPLLLAALTLAPLPSLPLVILFYVKHEFVL
jgi:hypothetical protein